MEHWTKHQTEWLTENYKLLGRAACSLKLGKSLASIRMKSARLGLKSGLKNSDSANQKRSAALVGKKRPEHSLWMKKNYIEKVARPYTKERLKKMSERMKAEVVCGRKMNLFKGRKHSKESKKKIGDGAKKAWQNPNSKFNTEEFRQMKSDHASKLQQSGVFASRYSRSKKSWETIGGKRHFFRSAWEVAYAHYLEFLKSQNQIIDWLFEPETFWFEAIRRGVRSYKPDFKVFTAGGKFEYHEVKGWMDGKSKTKLKRMAKYYPLVKVVVIDSKRMKPILKWRKVFVKPGCTITIEQL